MGYLETGINTSLAAAYPGFRDAPSILGGRHEGGAPPGDMGIVARPEFDSDARPSRKDAGPRRPSVQRGGQDRSRLSFADDRGRVASRYCVSQRSI